MNLAQPGSCLMISLKGLSLLKEEKKFILSNHIAGVVLFQKNVQSFSQIYELCSEIKSLTRPPLLIAIDMEGGTINRFSLLKESPPWPSPQILKTFPSRKISLMAKSMGRQLYALGIDINFAPVVDLPIVKSPLLKDRVFGQTKEEILKYSSPFIEGLIDAKLIPCLKHFPGHGGVSEDSHELLPKDSRQIKDLTSQLDIFTTLFNTYPCWIMTAHIEFTNIDKIPATFSNKILTDILKIHEGFKGILVSDDVDMKALEKFSLGERFFNAIKAGCNLVISCQNSQSPQEILNYFQKNPHQKSFLKKELKDSSTQILAIRQKLKSVRPHFKKVQREIKKLLKFS